MEFLTRAFAGRAETSDGLSFFNASNMLTPQSLCMPASITHCETTAGRLRFRMMACSLIFTTHPYSL
jgi:hypothetical protein